MKVVDEKAYLKKNASDRQLADCQTKLAAVLKENEKLKRERMVGRKKAKKRSRSAESV
ncbi:MAG: hypothetical protein GY737_02570 [Desulfobacteraceae bacterium]|nr:hypothetical protein [Desulfobacteraceae bacterium]